MPGPHVRGICQRCGFEYPLHKLRREWTGLLVCKEDYDVRHPQDYVRGVRDEQAVRNPSPDPTPVYIGVGDVTGDDL